MLTVSDVHRCLLQIGLCGSCGRLGLGGLVRTGRPRTAGPQTLQWLGGRCRGLPQLLKFRRPPRLARSSTLHVVRDAEGGLQDLPLRSHGDGAACLGRPLQVEVGVPAGVEGRRRSPSDSPVRRSSRCVARPKAGFRLDELQAISFGRQQLVNLAETTKLTTWMYKKKRCTSTNGGPGHNGEGKDREYEGQHDDHLGMAATQKRIES
mmetsp:Transcript_103472/g.262762  ORF Transcript_103472/g.262762 Transcript_103472/m.262762 type:complete len:207 (+) Transcript_103472:221-841(+)